MVPGITRRIQKSDISKLRIWQQQRLPLHGRAGVLRIQSEERAGEVGAKEINRCGVPRRRRTQILRRQEVNVPADGEARSAIADIGAFNHETARKLPLDAERPALRIGLLARRRKVRDGLAEIRLQATLRT